MSTTSIASIVLAGVLLSGSGPVRHADAARAECRKFCRDAIARCRDLDPERKQCRRSVRRECRQEGPQLACRPNYTGTWTFTPIGAVTDDCKLTGGDLTALTRLVVRESRTSDSVSGELGGNGEYIYGYMRSTGATILEGTTHLDGCELGIEIFIEPSAALSRYATEGEVRMGGLCGDRVCCVGAVGRWDWQPS
jgi:hypothetical protein